MRASQRQHRTLRALFLGLLLVCAQALAHAHDVVHDPGGEPEVCTTCSVGGSLKASAESTTGVIIPRPVDFAPTVTETPDSVEAAVQTPEARAPPRYS